MKTDQIKIKLKTNLMIMEIVFLLIVVGGSTVVYSIFAAPFYNREKARLAEQAFEDIREMDLANLRDQDWEVLESYEEEHFSFIISDDQFEPVYTTVSRDQEGTVRRNIEIQKDVYTREPRAVLRNTRSYGGVQLRGIVDQDGRSYYVCIRETSGSSYSAFFYTEQFLAAVVIVAIVLGSVVMFVLGRRITKPIEEMAAISRRLAEHDFSARMQEETPYAEVNTLARNFNEMADQVQYYIQELEKDNSKLENRNVRLQEEKDQKERMERMRQEFNANISHELKTPLAVISSQMEMLELLSGEKDEKKQYYFSSIREEIDKMSDMVRSLLKISSAEHELEELDRRELDLSEMTLRLLQKYDALFRKKQIRHISHMDQNCFVLADRSCMEKAMGNYILNAVSHTGPGSRIEVSTDLADGQVIFRVYNQGPGIREDKLESIWNSYYQDRPGDYHAGLGLYIVKTVILLHGGAYGVKNREDGVEFWFSLPACRSGKEE